MHSLQNQSMSRCSVGHSLNPWRSIVLSTALCALLPGAALCAPGEPAVFPLCTGYNPQSQEWGFPEIEIGNVVCPKNYAFLGARGLSGRSRPAKFTAIYGECCPLPEEALSETHTWVQEQCPPDSVVTGTRSLPGPPESWDGHLYEIRCTHLQLDRFTLGDSLESIEYGLLPRRLWNIVTGIPDYGMSRGQLPPALRYGIGRISRSSWSYNGCVPLDLPALLTAKKGSRCRDLEFRRLLQINDQPERPASGKGSIVGMQPCRAVVNLYKPDAHCVE